MTNGPKLTRPTPARPVSTTVGARAATEKMLRKTGDGELQEFRGGAVHERGMGDGPNPNER